MAIYRQIQTSFWQDNYVASLNPDEKFFYLYLMTNAKTSQCGIYEITPQLMMFETGLTKKSLEKLLKKLILDEKIEFSDEFNEIFIKNWLKYNFSNSPYVIKRIEQERKAIKTPEFKESFETVYRLYVHSGDTHPQVSQGISKSKRVSKSNVEIEVKDKRDAPTSSLEAQPLFLTPNNSHPEQENQDDLPVTKSIFIIPLDFSKTEEVRNSISSLYRIYCNIDAPDKATISGIFNLLFDVNYDKNEAFDVIRSCFKEFKTLKPEKQRPEYLYTRIKKKLESWPAVKREKNAQKDKESLNIGIDNLITALNNPEPEEGDLSDAL